MIGPRRADFGGSRVGPVLGTPTNDAAAAGDVGELISSVVGVTNTPTTDARGDLTSISLTAGDWDVTAVVQFDINGATWTRAEIAITSTAGNSTTGFVSGSNQLEMSWASSSTTPVLMGMVIPSFRVSLASTTTYYLKFSATFTLGQPRAGGGRLSARRVR